MSTGDRAYLRVVGVLDSEILLGWQWGLLDDIQRAECAALVGIVIRGPGRTTPHPDAAGESMGWMGRAYVALERRLHRGLEDPLQARDVAAFTDSVAISPIPANGGKGLTARTSGGVSGSVEELPDVLLYLGASESSGYDPASARFGEWCCAVIEQDRGDVVRSALWHVVHGVPVVESTVRWRRRELSAPVLVYRGATATDVLSVRRTLAAASRKLARFVLQLLEEVREQGELALERRQKAAETSQLVRSVPPPVARSPEMGMCRIVRHLGRQLCGKLVARLARPRWMLYYALDDGPGEPGLQPDLRRFKPLTAPRDRFWADPHVVRRGENYYIFVEEYMYALGRGRISVVRLGRNGEVTSSRVVVEQRYHMAYPFVFSWRDELWMVPDTGLERRVDVYRCVEFPLRWEWTATLMTGLKVFDATLVQEAGRWWLFAYVVHDNRSGQSDELFLFDADNPLSTAWRPHPLNPVVSDARLARPAGAFFRRGGVLFRPSQDCTGRYGRAVNINRVVRLGHSEYAEVREWGVEPGWRPGVMGTHTISYAPGLTVVDAFGF